MKNSKYFMALSLAIALNVSCSKFDDGPAFSFIPVESRLTGEWVVMEFEGPYSNYYNAYLALGYFISFEFEKDGDGRFVYGYDNGVYFYQEGYALDWDLDDNKLELFFDGDVVNFEVQRLTNKEMTLQVENDSWFEPGMVLKLEKE